MKPTRIRLLLAVAVLGGALGWATTFVIDERFGHYLSVPWTAPMTFLLLGIALLLWTRSVRARLARKPGTRPLPPIVAARTAALAMAASRVGAFFFGWYLGVIVAFLHALDVPAVQVSALSSGGCVLGALLVAVAALWLERSCRLPDPPPDEDGGKERTASRSPGVGPAPSRVTHP